MDYRQHLSDAEAKYKLPKGLLHAQMQAESGGNPNAVSQKGAQGIMQFMPGTAKQYDIDPLDPIQSIDGAGRMMREMLDQTGSLRGAVAAYNWGIGNVKRKGLDAMPQETRDYIQRVSRGIKQHAKGATEAVFNATIPSAKAGEMSGINLENVKWDKSPATNAEKINNIDHSLVKWDEPKQGGMLEGVVNTLGNTAKGVASGFADIGDTIINTAVNGGESIKNAVSSNSNPSAIKQWNDDRTASLEGFNKENSDSTAFNVGRVGANIAATLPVGGVIGQGVKALGAAANTSKLIPLAEAITSGGMKAGGAGMATRVAGGAISGGATASLVNPDDAGVGAVVGGALPPALKVASATSGALARIPSAAKSFIEPFYESGQNAIIGRALNTATGGYADDAIRNLQNAQQLVPGVLPTAAESADNAGLAALQRASIASNPIATNEMTLRQAANNNARASALDDIIPDRAAAIQARDQATNQLYNKSSSSQVSMTPELESLLQRPSMQNALSRANQLANEAGESFDINNLNGRGAQYLKMALDDLSNASPMTGIGGNELRAIQGTKHEYIDQLGQQIPEYLEANKQYATLSQPLNQADVLEEIAAKSKDFRGNMTPAATSRAVSDKTVQRVTGRDSATLNNTLTPDQLRMVESIKSSLMQKDFADTAGRGVGSNTVQNLAYTNMLDQAGIPSSLRGFAPVSAVGNVAAKIADFGYKRANDQLAEKLSLSLMNPETTAEMMQGAIKAPKSVLVRDLIEGLNQTTYKTAPVISSRN